MHEGIQKRKKKDPDVLLSSGSFFTFPWRFLRHCRRPTNDLAFLRRAPLHRFASRLLFIYPGTNGRRTADVGGQRRRTTLLVPHKRDTRISILALARFSLSPAGQLWLRGDKERRKGRTPYERALWNSASGSDLRRVCEFDWLFRRWMFLLQFQRGEIQLTKRNVQSCVSQFVNRSSRNV